MQAQLRGRFGARNRCLAVTHGELQDLRTSAASCVAHFRGDAASPRLFAAALTVAVSRRSRTGAARSRRLANDTIPQFLDEPIDPRNLEVTTAVDTTEATTQPDLFNPQAGRAAARRGPASENTACKGAVFGKTVWYDLPPKFSGGVELRRPPPSRSPWPCTSGTTHSQITRMVYCSSNATVADPLLPTLLGGKRSYTIQIGGVARSGRPGQV